MEPNNELEKPKESFISKKIIISITLICLIVGGIAWYFLYFIKTPEYSLKIIKDATEKHDIVKFNKHVDLDSTLSRGYDDLMEAAIDSDKTISPEAKAFANGFIQMLKPALVNGLKDGISRYVETGKWEAEKATTNKKDNFNPDEITNKSGLKNSTFKGVAYTKKDGKTAIVGLKLFDQDVKKEFVLDVKMRQLEDGTWQIAELSNFKEYIADLEKAKNDFKK